jgi:hypothetical protein
MSPLAILALLLQTQEATGAYSVGPESRVKDVRVRKVTACKPIQYGPLVLPQLFIPAGGSSILVCEPRGYVRRISLPELKVEAEARLPASVTAYALSRSGLLAASRTNNDLRILDASSLELTQTIETKATKLLASCAELDIAYISVNHQKLGTLNLPSSQIVREHDNAKIHEESSRRVARPEGDNTPFGWDSFNAPLCSPDGRYLFSGERSLHRFAVSGFDLLYEEVMPLPVQGAAFDISLDSRFITVPGIGGMPSYVLSASDLKKKVVVIPEEYRVTALIVDVAGDRLIALEEKNEQVTLSIFSMKGEKTAEYALGNHGRVVRRLHLHPASSGVAVALDTGFLWVRWK